MPAIAQISDAKWEVMKAVWDGGPLTAGQVVDRLARRTTVEAPDAQNPAQPPRSQGRRRHGNGR
jgi:hypothetical protein